MQHLGNMQIDSLVLEGGSLMNWSALEQQIVDELKIYIAPKILEAVPSFLSEVKAFLCQMTLLD